MSERSNILLLFNCSAAFDRGLLRGIIRYSYLHGPWQFDLREVGDKGVEPFLGLGFDGIIAPDLDNVQDAERIIASGIPSIVFGSRGPCPTHYNIYSNDTLIGQMAADHLLDRGFRHFAFCGYESLWWSQRRCDSFCARIAANGYKVNCYDRPHSERDFSQDEEEAYVIAWLKTLARPVGLMACEDERARRIVEFCRANSIDVPEDIAVVGVDNDDIRCELANPPLSSVAMNCEKGGYEAAEMLDMLLAGKTPPKRDVIVEPTQVVTRRTTDTVAISDEEVSTAMKFIRANANKPIHVDDVLQKVTCSRTELYRRFVRVLGHSVYDEIKRTRVRLFAQMLIETNHPIEYIARILDGPERKNVARWFQKIMGLSPRDYRKKFLPK